MTKAILRGNYNRLISMRTMDLFGAYAKPSEAKKKAYERCEEERCSKGGYNGSVVSYNCNIFTYGYLYDDADGQHFVYITPTNRYDKLVAFL